MPGDPLSDLRTRVEQVLQRQHRHQAEVLAPLGSEPTDLLDAVFSLLGGGKRLRAGFLYWGYRAAGGPDSEALVRAASAMEVFQAAALIHDDVMDASDVRRGLPTAHRRLATLHQQRGLLGDADRFGEAGAILAGDLCLNWTDEIYSTSGLPDAELARGRATLDTMRTQLMGGQYLDVVEAAQTWRGLSFDQRMERARRVIRYKSAKYTVEQPLLIGAACAGASEETLTALSAYGLALGEAFQLRDDLLGVFGDPSETGKPAGDDLREGKRTVLIAYLLEELDDREAERFAAVFGEPDISESAISWLRERAVDTGAVQAVEALIERLRTEAADALESAELTATGRQTLVDLIDVSTARNA